MRPLPSTILASVLAAVSSAQTPTPVPLARTPAAWRSSPMTRPIPPAAPLSMLVGGSDSCATPDVLAGPGIYAFDDTSATTGTQGQTEAACNQLGAGSAILRDVWFRWTASANATARVET